MGIVHDSEDASDHALKPTLQRNCKKATESSLKAMEMRVRKHVWKLQEAFMDKVGQKLETRSHQLEVLNKRRNEANHNDLLQKLYTARLELEGLKLDAKIAYECSKTEKFGYHGEETKETKGIEPRCCVLQ